MSICWFAHAVIYVRSSIYRYDEINMGLTIKRAVRYTYHFFKYGFEVSWVLHAGTDLLIQYICYFQL